MSTALGRMAVWEIILSRESRVEVNQHSRGVNDFFLDREPSLFQKGSHVSVDLVAEHQILEKCSTHPWRTEDPAHIPLKPWAHETSETE